MKTKNEILETIEQAKKELVLAKNELENFNENKHGWVECYRDLNMIDFSPNAIVFNYENETAYIKLQRLRSQIIKDWQPDYTDEDESKYAINCVINKVSKCTMFITYCEFTFETAEQRDWFLKQHIELLNIYYGVIN